MQKLVILSLVTAAMARSTVLWVNDDAPAYAAPGRDCIVAGYGSSSWRTPEQVLVVLVGRGPSRSCRRLSTDIRRARNIATLHAELSAGLASTERCRSNPSSNSDIVPFIPRRRRSLIKPGS
jgi:hypothetical protein